jgi:integrase
MARRPRWTQRKIDELEVRAKPYLVPVAEVPGLYVRVRESGRKTFTIVGRNPNNKQLWREVKGALVAEPFDDVFKKAREGIQRLQAGQEPFEAPAKTKTVADVIDNFLARWVRVKLRSIAEYERALLKQVVPAIGKTGIHNLKRSHINDMLDKIEDEHGPVQADRTLAYLRKALNWYAVGDDKFVPPIVPGMSRTSGKERARDRVLTDDEIRVIWPCLSGTFGGLCKTLLLTAQRRTEVAGMRWDEIDAADVWSIPASRYKTKHPHFVPLSPAARAVIDLQPRIAGSPFVFSGRTGTGHFVGYSKSKPALDKAVTAANGGVSLPNWTLHDLRRTARSLMSRVKVVADVAERTIGHAIPGVRATYDKHDFLDEKRDALVRIAAEIERILNPPPSNVVALGGRA